MNITPDEMSQLKSYLERIFKCSGLTVKKRDRVDDSIEVMMNGEHIGIIYKLEDEGEISFDFNMSILDIDLSENP